MSSNVPTVRQFSWTAIPPQLATITVFSIAAHFIGLDEYLGIHGGLANLMYGAIGQIILWFIIRNTYAKFHKQGMDLVKQEKYADAIPLFEDSYEMFTKHSWVDKYRHFLGSSSKMTYKEMDLNNIAFCYGQSGEKEKSIEYYRRTLTEYPDSGIAKAALNMIETMTGNNK
jgi:tetratricopeptide (TPR) repeat protein